MPDVRLWEYIGEDNMLGLSLTQLCVVYLVTGFIFATVFYCCTHIHKEGFWTPGWWCEYYIVDKPHPMMFVVFLLWPLVLAGVIVFLFKWIYKNFGNLMRYVLGWPIFVFGSMTDTKVEKSGEKET